MSSPAPSPPRTAVHGAHRRRSGAGVSAALGLLLLTALVGCSTGSAPDPGPASPTPISRLDATGVTVPRIDFCALLPDRAVDAAIGADAWQRTAYGNGDRARPGTGEADVMAEHGCTWSAEQGTASARAWMFAVPVDHGLADLVVRDADRDKGCRVVRGPAFGDPSLTQRCRADGVGTVRHAGLFGDTWLACEVADQARPRMLGERADAWCAAVVGTLDTSR